MALVLLIAVTVLPVVAVIAILYNSPFAFFLPPLESGDTVTTVTSAYVSEFNRDINTLANEHTGYDTGQIVYVDFEGESAGNFNDIVTIYMVKYGVGDTATVMNDTSKSKLKEVFDDMCSYTTSSGSQTTENEDGSTTTQTILYVNVKLKTCYDMITEYNFDSDQIELVEEMMRMFGSTSGVIPQSALTQAEVDAILQGITDPTQRTVVSYALTKVGYQTLASIDGFGEGMRMANEQLANSFRVLAGKKQVDYSKKEYAQSNVAVIRKPWEWQKKVYQNLELHLDAAIDKIDNLAKDVEIQKNEKKWDELYDQTHQESKETVQLQALSMVSEPEYEYGAEAFEAFQKNNVYKSDVAIVNDDMKKIR